MITDQYAMDTIIIEINQELNDKFYAEEVDNIQIENEIIDDIQSLFSENDWKDKSSNVIENNNMSLKKRLTIFYKKYCPDKIPEIGKLINKYGNKEKELFRKLTFKYGPEPKMSEADKKTIIKRQMNNIKPKDIKPKDIKPKIIVKNTSSKESFDGVYLDEKTLKLLEEIDQLGKKPITKHILDRI